MWDDIVTAVQRIADHTDRPGAPVVSIDFAQQLLESLEPERATGASERRRALSRTRRALLRLFPNL